MGKKTLIIIIMVVFLVMSTISFSKVISIEKNTNNNSKNNTTSIKKNIVTTVNEKKKEENIMDGITLNYHSSIRIEKDGKVIYFDPFKISSLKEDADYIFITHSHYDHYSEDDIRKIMKNNTKFIITSDLENKVMNLGVDVNNIIIITPNETKNIDDLKFDVIPAYNINKSYHKKSYNWVGYNLTLNNIKYYIVGDSDATEDLKNIKCDVIFIPVGGIYTMTNEEASNIVNEIKPKIAIPIHYGEVGSRSDAENFVNSLEDNIEGIILE